MKREYPIRRTLLFSQEDYIRPETTNFFSFLNVTLFLLNKILPVLTLAALQHNNTSYKHKRMNIIPGVYVHITLSSLQISKPHSGAAGLKHPFFKPSISTHLVPLMHYFPVGYFRSDPIIFGINI